MQTMADMSPGQQVVVDGVVAAAGDGPAITLRRRLLELGLVPGTPVTVVRRAPLGDPLEITLRGYALSLRRDEAALIMVRPSSMARPS
jgi:ferrous iron transport protein A